MSEALETDNAENNNYYSIVDTDLAERRTMAKSDLFKKDAVSPKGNVLGVAPRHVVDSPSG